MEKGGESKAAGSYRFSIHIPAICAAGTYWNFMRGIDCFLLSVGIMDDL